MVNTITVREAAHHLQRPEADLAGYTHFYSGRAGNGQVSVPFRFWTHTAYTLNEYKAKNPEAQSQLLQIIPNNKKG